VKAASCIDPETVEKVCGYPIHGKKDTNQRPGCGCMQSIDIGIYNTCKNGCVYCYANYSDSTVAKNCSLHDPSSDLLIGEVGPDERIIVRKEESLREEQTKLF
jgi:DNA repair photolyase